jgi:hypothetical protein
MKTCVSGLNALFRGTKVEKHPFYSIGPKMIYGSVTEDSAKLLHLKRCKTCVSVLNALIGGTKVANNPYYSIGPKMMFGRVTEHFANLRHVKDAKLVLQVWMHNFEAPKLRSICSTPLDTKWYMGVLRRSSLIFYTQKDQNLSFRPECTIWAPKFRSIHSTPSDPKFCLRVFQSTSLTFGM